MSFRITSSSLDRNDVRVETATAEVLGDAYRTTYATRAEAEAMADELRGSVGSAGLPDSTEYEVVEEEEPSAELVAEAEEAVGAWLDLGDDDSSPEAHAVTTRAVEALRDLRDAGGDLSSLRRRAERANCDLDGLLS